VKGGKKRSVVSYHLKACPHCRRKVRQSPNFAVVSPFSATVSLFCDSVDRAWSSGLLLYRYPWTGLHIPRLSVI